MAKTYLDETGLALVWAKIKASFSTQAYQTIRANQKNVTATTLNDTLNIVGGGSVSVDGDAENKTVTISSTGEANTINTVKVNGTALTPDSDKAVNVLATVNVHIGTVNAGSPTFIPKNGTPGISSAEDGKTVVIAKFGAFTSTSEQLKFGWTASGSYLPAYYYTPSGTKTSLIANRVNGRTYAFLYVSNSSYGEWILIGDLDTNTDTHYTTHLYATTSSGTSNAAVATNGNLYLRLFDNTTARESHKLTGAGGISVTSDSSGNITFTGTTYNAMSESEATTGTAETSRVITAKVLKAAMDNAIAAAQVGAATFKGTVDAYSEITGDSYKKGWYWLVKTAGTYAGQSCEAGDMIFAISDKGSSAANTDFTVVQTNMEPISEITNSTINTICV